MTAISLVPKAAGESVLPSARSALREACRGRSEALAACENARETSARARAYVAEASNALQRLVQADAAMTQARAGEVRAALVSGARPCAPAQDAPPLALELHDARSHHAAAVLAEAEILQDQAKADYALTAAESAMMAARKAVVLEEASALASGLEDLEVEIARLQEKIGLRSSFVGHLLSPPSGSPLSRAMAGIVWETGGKPMLRSERYSRFWRQFFEALAEDPSAELRLD